MDLPASVLYEARGRRIQEGKQVIDLSMINPDIPPSTALIDWLHEFSIKQQNHRYSVSRGIRKLREAFATKYRQKFNISLNPETEVCVSSGTKDALFHVLTRLASPGDVVLVGRPTYPAYEIAAQLARLHTAYFPLLSDESQMLEGISQALEITRAKIIVLNFPNNPTGISVSKEFFIKVAELAQRWNTFVINDFVYGEMGFHATPSSLLSVRGEYENLLEIYSMSKAYSIPGWRVGAVLGASDVVSEVARVKSLSDYGLFIPFQMAAAVALTTSRDIVRPLISRYERRIEMVTQGLSEHGWKCAKPSGGVALWIPLPEYMQGVSSIKFALELLNSHGVMVSPGVQFGDAYDQYIRLAPVTAEEKLSEVVESFVEVSRRWIS